MRFSYNDYYDLESTVFHYAQGTVTVHDKILANALTALPSCWCDIVLMFYFMHQTNRQIGKALGLTPDATHYRRKSSIRKMRKQIEDCNYEV